MEENRQNNIKATKEDAYKTLERTIAFNNTCDSKATTILTVYGVLITVSLTSDGVTTIKTILKTSSSNLQIRNIIYLLILGASLLGFVIGTVYIMLVLLSKTNCEEYSQDGLDLNSIIYFGNIADSEKNINYLDYKKKVMQRTEDEMLNDIISQIYLNSKICNRKYKNYKKGFLISIISLFVFIMIWIIGYVVY